MSVASYLLRRIADDPSLAYYFDPMTQSMELLTSAHAQEQGLDVEEFRKTYYAKLKFEKPTCPECRD